MKYRNTVSAALFGMLTFCAQISFAQQDFSKVEIKSSELGHGIYMLTGAGGNIGLSVGSDGVFMIDDQFAPLSEKILAAIADISDKPVKYLLNTHWHGDHTGGNESFGTGGAVIVSHENVRKRLSTKQFMKAFGSEVPAAPKTALPVITFAGDATFNLNSETIQVKYLADAHTDGDSAVIFVAANVVHMGDTFFNGFFPFIDQSGGGTLDGLIASVGKMLDSVDDNTKIIPGHGPLARKADLATYQAMLLNVHSTMKPLIDAGKSRETVVAENPLSALGETWGNGFMKTDVFTGIVYDVMSDT